MGGEEPKGSQTVPFARGLPPRGRGRGGNQQTALSAMRITPAWAGKRAAQGADAAPQRDYPRVGGEEMSTSRRATPVMGLPPRGRGRACCSAPVAEGSRITPAWAGKSHPPAARLSRTADYPRVGGEEPGDSFKCDVNVGLPPRGRGRVDMSNYIFYSNWITPAWAGKRDP